jgi:hypothetical protein
MKNEVGVNNNKKMAVYKKPVRVSVGLHMRIEAIFLFYCEECNYKLF